MSNYLTEIFCIMLATSHFRASCISSISGSNGNIITCVQCVAIFKRFKNSSNYIDQTKYEDTSTDEEVVKYAQDKDNVMD